MKQYMRMASVGSMFFGMLLMAAAMLASACTRATEPAASSGAHGEGSEAADLQAHSEHGDSHNPPEQAHAVARDEHAAREVPGEPGQDAEHEGVGETEGHHEHSQGQSSILAVDADALRDLRITTAMAQRRPEGMPVSALGELQVDEGRYAEIGAALPARVLRLLANEGDVVRAGQPLAELESAEVGRARAALLQATARHTLATRSLERKQALVEGGSVSRREIEEAEAELAEADAELRASRASLESMGVLPDGPGGRFSLVSPLAGTVLSREVHLGSWLEPQHTAFRVANLANLWVVAAVFERDAVQLSEGAPATVMPTALPGTRLPAQITRVGAEVQSEARTVQVRLRLDGFRAQLKPGMSANVQLATASPGAAQVITVPLAAVQRVDDHWVVFLPKGEGRFEVRSIGRGRDLGGEVEVLSGLDAGTELVVEGSFVLRAISSRGEGGGDHHH